MGSVEDQVTELLRRAVEAKGLERHQLLDAAVRMHMAAINRRDAGLSDDPAQGHGSELGPSLEGE